ncbi:hypothetical protein PIN31009_04596 [Pandoraea iniqua]|uniref:Polysaccharide chain length determinant N-terminal domain-containing protein n=2 Tax=Pandoraea iniqua TaxID=2508288 RepID=A0A5E4YMS2_9BURK|nr:hypothetical protein [Pandoraea iniqua]VVE50076.1 hypothetical protein PIN31009_04596 [Pandoraea iniqua]VVE52738.1 hypothetical protein PIN31115_04779 [Pandoraea iniqua]
MNNDKTLNKTTSEGLSDLTLADVLDFVRTNAKWIAGLAIVGGAIGVGCTYLVQKQWEGKLTLQVGRAAGSPVSGPDGPLIESVQQTVGRVGLNTFRDDLTEKVLPELKGNLEALHNSVVWKTIKARAVQGTTYVEIVARGTSEQQAGQALSTAAQQILTEHAAILERVRDLPKQQLSVIDAAIDANTKAQEQLGAALAQSKNTDSVMALSALQSSRSERAVLNDSRYRVSQLLAPDQSYNTRIVSAVQVDDHAVYPRKLYFGGGGLVLGGILGVLIGLCRKKSPAGREV